MRRAYFVVEGPHDLEVVGRMLKLHKAKRVKHFDDLDEFWHRLVPRKFPHEGDLLRRVPVPVFFASDELSVAVQVAGSVEQIPSVATATWANLDNTPEGFGVLLDADDKDVQKRWSDIVAGLPVENAGASPGEVAEGSPRAGVFILPDNQSAGTLEHLLLECAAVAYPSLLSSAKDWIDPISPDDKTIFSNSKERKDFSKPSGKHKAIASSIASVLRPGKSIQVSIQDNRWLTHPDVLNLANVQALKAFVDAIVGQPVVAA